MNRVIGYETIVSDDKSSEISSTRRRAVLEIVCSERNTNSTAQLANV